MQTPPLAATVTIVLLAVSAGLATASVTPVENRRPRGAILISPDPSPTEQFAAEEIQRVARQATGAELPIVSQPPDGPFISVGRTEPAADLGYEADAASPDPYLIRTLGEGVFVIGRGDRGTIYAAYDLLRRFLGVRWIMPGDAGEIIPQSDDFTVPDVDIDESPAFRFRIASGFRSPEYVDWAIRNRLHILSQTPASWGDPEMAKRGGYMKGTMHHAFDGLLPEAEYFEEHPECYALRDGVRRAGRGTQICVSNPDVRRIVAEKAVEYFDQHPEATFFSLCPNDNQNWCECDACTAYDTETMERWGRTFPVVSDRYFAFVNEVADRLAQEHPGKLLYTFAYQNYTWPPKTHLPRPNVIVSLCHMVPACYSHPLTDEECERNRQFNALLSDWAGVHENMWYYAYTCKSMWEQMPWPIARRLAADIRRLHEAGFQGFFSQGWEWVWGQLGVNFRVMAQMLWDPETDVEAALDEYFDLAFGPASPAMHEFYQAVEEAFTAPDVHVHHEVGEWGEKVLPPQTRRRATAALERARELAGGDQTLLTRIAPVAAAYRYAELRVEGLEAERRWRRTGDVEALQRATEAYSEIMQIAEANPGGEALRIHSVNRYVRPRYEAMLLPYDALIAPEDRRRYEWTEVMAESFELTPAQLAGRWQIPDEEDAEYGIELSTSRASDGETSLRLWSAVQSENSDRWTALQSDWVIVNAISERIPVEPGEAILVTARVFVPEDLQMTSRGATLGLIGWDEQGGNPRGWSAGSTEVTQQPHTEGWRQMAVGRIVPGNVERLAVRLAICGLGECYVDQVRVLRGAPVQ
ncbi:MAG: DUF4838 domain-containing protein [Armatimonadota bacterium]